MRIDSEHQHVETVYLFSVALEVSMARLICHSLPSLDWLHPLLPETTAAGPCTIDSPAPKHITKLVLVLVWRAHWLSSSLAFPFLSTIFQKSIINLEQQNSLSSHCQSPSIFMELINQLPTSSHLRRFREGWKVFNNYNDLNTLQKWIPWTHMRKHM